MAHHDVVVHGDPDAFVTHLDVAITTVSSSATGYLDEDGR